MSDTRHIPIMRPHLPDHQHFVMYLKEIDQNRWYSNFGPLVVRLEERLADFFEIGKEHVASISSCTAGLVNVLRAMELPRDSYCIVPSWTFAATPAAAVAANLIPYFADVREDNWALDPNNIKETIGDIDGHVSCVITVAPFGSPIDIESWDQFTEDTGIPVIIDGAAAFDTIAMLPQMKPSKTPIVVSMHATKVCGMGEGGFVMCNDAELIKQIRYVSNYGFSNDDRRIRIIGTNNKMSEYSAAVGLSALDLWPQKREVWMRLKRHYIKAFSHIPDTPNVPWLSEDWVSSTCNIRLPFEDVPAVISRMEQYGIETRQWWLDGCHQHPAYKQFPHADLPVTQLLGRSVIGLPFSIDLSKEDIYYVTESLAYILDEYKQQKVG